MTAGVIIAVILALAVIAIVASARKAKASDITVPAPAALRTDLLLGYYGTYGDQVAETAGAVNLHWESFWSGVDRAIEDIRRAAVATVLDLDSFVFDVDPKTNARTPFADAEQRVRALFARLRDAGVLRHVRVLVPKDEPNLSKGNVLRYLPSVVPMVRRVAADFDDLSGVLLGVIYMGGSNHDYAEMFDVVGFDDYSEKSAALKPGGMYDRMQGRLLPGQRTWIVPGASYGQSPEPWVNFAHAHHEVFAIVPFLWATVPWESDFKGIRDIPDMRAAWTAAGAAIKESQL